LLDYLRTTWALADHGLVRIPLNLSTYSVGT